MSFNSFNYWKNKTSSEHSSKNFISSEYCASLEWILHANLCNSKNILDYGCGAGEIYFYIKSYLESSHKNYRGLDISQSMIDAFILKHPDVNLSCGTLDNNEVLEGVDTVILSHVVQHLSEEDLLRIIYQIQQSCVIDKIPKFIVLIGVPLKQNYFRYITGFYLYQYKFSMKSIFRTFKSYLKHQYKGFDSIGFWYDLSIFHQLNNNPEFSVEFLGSVLYPYRLNIIIKISS
jgi:SAM-dependent methyltransferase